MFLPLTRLAGGRKGLTDEMARGAMIWDQSCPAKGSQVAAQLPQRKNSDLPPPSDMLMNKGHGAGSVSAQRC